MFGILPAAGTATRLGGLPKFLLPLTSSEDTLIRRHIEGMRPYVEQIQIVTRPENAFLLAPYLDEMVSLQVLVSNTMSQTVRSCTSLSRANSFLVGLPDTIFTSANPYREIAKELASDHDMVLGVWKMDFRQRGQLGQVRLNSDGRVLDSVDKNPDCKFEHFWGAMGFKQRVLEMIDPETPHIGYSIKKTIEQGWSVMGLVQSGRYIDCGTSEGYRSLQEFIVGS